MHNMELYSLLWQLSIYQRMYSSPEIESDTNDYWPEKNIVIAFISKIWRWSCEK